MKTQAVQDTARIFDANQKIVDFIQSLQALGIESNQAPSGVTQLPSKDGKFQYLFDIPTLKTALQQTEDARAKLASVTAAVKTANFQLPTFTDFYKGYEEDFRDIEKMLSYYHDYYHLAINTDINAMSQSAKQVHDYRPKFQEATEALELRSSASRTRMHNLLTVQDIENNKRDIDEFALSFRVFTLLALTALAFSLAFLTFRSRRTIQPSNPLHGGRPDISRAQRAKYAAGRLNRPRS